MDAHLQKDLFGIPDREPEQPRHLNCGMLAASWHRVPGIDGLSYRSGFLDDDAQRQLLAHIDAAPWRQDLERCMQHYGWRYDYRSRQIAADMKIGPLPGWLATIAHRLHDESGLFAHPPDQAIVNEYRPGQGIALHADRDCFGPAVATVSLGDDWEMRLRPPAADGGDRYLLLMRGSALVMTGEARRRWRHGIDKRKNENGAGRRPRHRRLSVTFRTVLQPQP